MGKKDKKSGKQYINPARGDSSEEEDANKYDSRDDHNSRDALAQGAKAKADFSARNLEQMKKNKLARSQDAQRNEAVYAKAKGTKGHQNQVRINATRDQKKLAADKQDAGGGLCAPQNLYDLRYRFSPPRSNCHHTAVLLWCSSCELPLPSMPVCIYFKQVCMTLLLHSWVLWQERFAAEPRRGCAVRDALQRCPGLVIGACHANA